MVNPHGTGETDRLNTLACQELTIVPPFHPHRRPIKKRDRKMERSLMNCEQKTPHLGRGGTYRASWNEYSESKLRASQHIRMKFTVY